MCRRDAPLRHRWPSGWLRARPWSVSRRFRAPGVTRLFLGRSGRICPRVWGSAISISDVNSLLCASSAFISLSFSGKIPDSCGYLCGGSVHDRDPRADPQGLSGACHQGVTLQSSNGRHPDRSQLLTGRNTTRLCRTFNLCLAVRCAPHHPASRCIRSRALHNNPCIP